MTQKAKLTLHENKKKLYFSLIILTFVLIYPMFANFENHPKDQVQVLSANKTKI